MAMISCYDLTIRAPGRPSPLLDGVSLDVESGSFAEIVGPAGAGKSLLFSLCSLRWRCESGKTIIAGRNLARLDPQGWAELRQLIGACAQQPVFLERRTVVENLILPFVARGQRDDALETVETVVRGTPLEECSDVPVGHLPHTHRRLAGVFRAVVGTPKLIVIDGGLNGVGEFGELAADALRKAFDDGSTVVLTGREESRFDRCRTVTFRLHDGRLDRDDDSADVAAKPREGVA